MLKKKQITKGGGLLSKLYHSFAYHSWVSCLFSDAILLVVYFKEIGEIGYILHHFAAIYAYYFVVVSNLQCSSICNH